MKSIILITKSTEYGIRLSALQVFFFFKYKKSRSFPKIKPAPVAVKRCTGCSGKNIECIKPVDRKFCQAFRSAHDGPARKSPTNKPRTVGKGIGGRRTGCIDGGYFTR